MSMSISMVTAAKSYTDKLNQLLKSMRWKYIAAANLFPLLIPYWTLNIKKTLFLSIEQDKTDTFCGLFKP